jgi:hypothetical protein
VYAFDIGDTATVENVECAARFEPGPYYYFLCWRRTPTPRYTAAIFDDEIIVYAAAREIYSTERPSQAELQNAVRHDCTSHRGHCQIKFAHIRLSEIDEPFAAGSERSIRVNGRAVHPETFVLFRVQYRWAVLASGTDSHVWKRVPPAVRRELSRR